MDLNLGLGRRRAPIPLRLSPRCSPLLCGENKEGNERKKGQKNKSPLSKWEIERRPWDEEYEIEK